MTQTAPAAPESEAPAEEQGETLGSFTWFLIKLALAVLIFRSFIFSPFSIPSESMLPRLMNGDYLIAAKWPYGFSSHSLPFSLPLIPGRIFAGEPEPGDVVIFKHPVDGADYIKRAIALPGETVEMRNGQLSIDGELVEKDRIEDFVVPVSPNTGCAWGGVHERTSDGEQCRYPRFLETLPSGRSYEVLDFGRTPQDDFGPLIVPDGQLFVLGDNRDNSQDSRFPPTPGGGVGLVPQENLVGRASMLVWSTDGSAEWLLPWTWFTAARWDRIGDGL
ncbi:signal peptidase I [Pelagerythrobacter marensis]|uniref:Signal peptidase I n=1 Tax=Pelagerythrobacter marensis TaxID=543877 RepID=A0A0G3X7E6_9SPHN|nr:signal peptidase I [Pelagerythrobacter marensis]AKM07092.1 Signal peptidase I [Pelagerythrobacter marensis]